MGSYEAYCLDQAVWFFGTTIQSELEKAGVKRQRGAGKMEGARKRVLARFLGSNKKASGFADPSAFFSSKKE